MTTPAWQWFDVLVRHDKGKITIKNYAPDADSAKRTVMAAEGCPERAILSVKPGKKPQ